MKLLHTISLVAVALVGASTPAVLAEPKQLFLVTAPKSVFDATLPTFQGELDVWRMDRADGGKVTAQIYAAEADVAKFQHTRKGRAEFFANETLIVRDPVNTEELLKSRAAIRAACTASTRRHLQDTSASKYVDNAFFDCFRQPSEVFAFLDKLVAENPTIFSKVPEITKTYEGRSVPVYKISTGSGRKPLYTQGLIHAREWIAGSSTFYVIAALLDGLRANDAAITNIFNEYEWHFVPILNIDGYQFSWDSTRLWRKNRRRFSSSVYGVDLNRNYPPRSFWGRGGGSQSSDTYPGTAMLSEPETSGSWEYIKKLQPYGAIDMHAYAGQILRAYGNQMGTPPAPYGPKLKVLGDAMAAAAGRKYVSILSAQLYVAYGCFDDAVFQELNKPTFTIEMAGSSFIAPESSIRSSGLDMFRAFVAFAQGMPTYWSGLQ